VVLLSYFVVFGLFMVEWWRGRDARVMVVCGLGYWIVVDGGVMNGKCEDCCNNGNALWHTDLTVFDRLCDVMCCSYHYHGIADPEETSIAASIALQAYFEGRKIDRNDMGKCVQYWRDNISEYSDPVGRKRDVCW
jgi:hypothetical protein